MEKTLLLVLPMILWGCAFSITRLGIPKIMSALDVAAFSAICAKEAGARRDAICVASDVVLLSIAAPSCH